MIDVEALKAKVDIVAVIGHFVKLEKAGKEWKAPCPFHAEKTPSFTVSPQKQFCHCFGCGVNLDVIGFVQEYQGVSWKEAVHYLDSNPPLQPQLSKPERPPLPDRVTSKPPADAGKPNMFIKKLGDPSMVWEYKDTDGGTLGYIARYETEEGKEIRAWTYGSRSTDGPTWGCGHWTKPRPLYHLDALGSRGTAPVLIVEGEKACDAAQKVLPGYVCITWPGGAQAWKQTDLTVLRAKTVLLWPDNDEPGVKAMQGIAAVIADPQGLACTVRIIDPAGMPAGWDAADFEGTTEELIEWARPRASDYIHKATELSTDQPSAGADVPPEPGSPFPASSGAAPALDRVQPPGDEQPPAYTEAPPPEGSTPTKPARARKPRLASVDGNAVRKPEIGADNLPPALSDSHLAQVWIEEHGDDWRYVADWSSSDKACWMEWDGTGWRRDKTDGYWPLVERVCIRAAHWPEGRALSENDRRKLTGAGKYGAIVQCVRKSIGIASISEDWDRDIWALGIPGGWVDLHDGSLHDGDKSRHISMRTSVVPVEGLHPLFDRVIERPAHGDAEMLAYLWNLCGYTLTGDVSQERFFYLLGPQNSGKSTLARVLSDIMGDYAAALPSEALIESNHPRHSQEWARLQNKRLVVSSELKGTSRWSEDLVKRVTSGEKITARYMRQNDLEWYPHFKLLVDGGQEIPSLSNPGGMERRLDLIEYPPLDCAMDTTLKARLVAEYPAILHSLIIAALQYREHGLPRPQQVQEDSADYISTQDNLGGWIEDRIIKVDGARLKTADARADFEAWLEKQDGRKPQYPVSPKLFALRMKGRGFAVAKSGVKFFLNVQLRDMDMFPSPD